MAIKPIDMQMIVPKATEIAKVQNVINENIDDNKAILAAGFQEQIKTKRQKINERDQIEKAGFRQEQRSNQKGSSKGKKKKEEKKEEEKKEEKKKKTNKKLNRHLDVKI